MPHKLSGNVSHSYDPGIVFHSHSSNLPHLNSWIDELISLTENSSTVRTSPTTNQLVASLQRYDAIFRELLRQTSIFSEPLTRMFAKTWAGVVKLLDYMIKSYHRYVKHTTHLQDQAQVLLKSQLTQAAAATINAEEYELQKTSLRARIRNLEAEVESLKLSKRDMDRENIKLRSTIDVYINSKEMNNPVWDLMNEDKLPDDENSVEIYDAFGGGSDHARDKVIVAGKQHLETINRLEIEMNQAFSNVLKEEDRQRTITTDIMTLLQKNQDLFGNGIMAAGGWQPGGTKVVETKEIGIQVDEKDKFGVVEDAIDSPREERDYSAPMSPSYIPIIGGHIPFQIRKYMKAYPQVLRIPPAAWVCQMIMAIYIDKIDVDNDRKSKNLTKYNLSQHTYHYFKRGYGMECIVDVQVVQLIVACQHYMHSLPRVALFASQIGLRDKEANPYLDIRDTDFIITIIHNLLILGELKSDSKTKSKKIQKRGSVTIRPDILRSAAVSTTTTVLEKFLPDGGSEYIAKVRTLPGTSVKGSRYVDIDQVIEVLMDPWQTVRLSWEEHLTFLFQQHCNIFRVISELQFATDGGIREKDVVLMQIHKKSAADCMRRNLRSINFESLKLEGEGGEKPKDSGALRKPPSGVINTNKEPVCEAMGRTEFCNVLNIMIPDMKLSEIDALFDEACELSYETTIRSLEKMWKRFTADAEEEILRSKLYYGSTGQLNSLLTSKGDIPYYVNCKTLVTQWQRPYHQRTFRTIDIELHTFISIILRHNILARG